MSEGRVGSLGAVPRLASLIVPVVLLLLAIKNNEKRVSKE
ncbi:32759_t:CDS:2 [Gigaspora margarita]|uniref:32759_t:CDS:1 n=1 Tax=Gigaspora margarita TaxID=4874 RepID=A0ABN7UGN0_GIGMA|nr:32759_t:CDS:2 [Gigaspora margarita]